MFHRQIHHRYQDQQGRRQGFTLVELMVVIGLLLLIAVMTASAINTTISGDKVRGGARQIQSYLAGARDRAIYSKSPRGVRFLLDSTDNRNRTVSSMVYIAPTDDWTQGAIQLEWGSSGTVNVVRGFDDPSNTTGLINPTSWYSLYQQGILKDGVRIRIPDDSTGEWYVINNTSSLTSTNPRLTLNTAYAKTGTTPVVQGNAAFNPGEGPTTYRMELPPSVLPNQEPVLLPKGCVIHLDRCTSMGNLELAAALAPGVWSNRADKLPSAWKRTTNTLNPDPSGFDYTSQMDVMFSPRGVVIGPAAQNGIIHLYVADQKDSDTDYTYWHNGTYPTVSPPEYGTWADPTTPGYERGDKIILTLFTRTGAVSTHPIHPTDTFKFAETGEVAGK